MKTNNFNACKQLLEAGTPDQWISYLFDLQNSLVGMNFFEGHTEKAIADHAYHFGSLKQFFESIRSDELKK